MKKTIRVLKKMLKHYRVEEEVKALTLAINLLKEVGK